MIPAKNINKLDILLRLRLVKCVYFYSINLINIKNHKYAKLISIIIFSLLFERISQNKIECGNKSLCIIKHNIIHI